MNHSMFLLKSILIHFRMVIYAKVRRCDRVFHGVWSHKAMAEPLLEGGCLEVALLG